MCSMLIYEFVDYTRIQLFTEMSRTEFKGSDSQSIIVIRVMSFTLRWSNHVHYIRQIVAAIPVNVFVVERVALLNLISYTAQ